MSRLLSINIHLHDGRYHGVPDWPPAPARLFQALLAGAARGARIPEEDQAALRWLEALPAPIITVPTVRQTRGFVSYVPNNDLDSKAGDPARVDEIRARKVIKTRLFDSNIPLAYHWSFADDGQGVELARSLCRVANKLYQFGRGVDMAWADSEVIEVAEAECRFEEFPGVVYRPCPQSQGGLLACPEAGSLQSLITRYVAHRTRLQKATVGRKGQQIFSQPPKPRFQQVAYGTPSALHLYDLMTPWPLAGSAELVRHIRDIASQRLADAFPDRSADIERVLIGRGAAAADKGSRVRILPLPSIGHPQADRIIRRVLVEVPPNCPIRAGDIDWAFSGLNLEADQETGEVRNGLIKSSERKMLRHYNVGEDRGVRRWRTVTAAVLPVDVARRRDDSRHVRKGSKTGSERLAEMSQAAGAVVQALRHACIREKVLSVRVQREPFDAKGAMAETFAKDTRFAKERLWHVDVELADPISGPLTIGDGRYLGLGLMAPVAGGGSAEGAYCFQILRGLNDAADPSVCSKALRRAVMARVQAEIGLPNALPMFFTGHEIDGSPSRRGMHAHLAFVTDISRRRLLVIAPHALEQRTPTQVERNYLGILDEAIRNLSDLRAGDAGRLTLSTTRVDPAEDPLFTKALSWESVTEYCPTRHAKRVTVPQAITIDVHVELRRLGLPAPTTVELTALCEGPRGGLSGRLRLRFKTAVDGPILIGRTRHIGGGLFAAVD